MNDPGPHPLIPATITDIGSNSVRTVFMNGDCRWPVEIYNSIKIQAGLGQGVSKSNLHLNDNGKPLARIVFRLTRARIEELREEYGQVSQYAYFTAAVRNAEESRDQVIRKDALAFHDTAESDLGFKIETISSEQEGRLAAYGVISSFPGFSGLVVDVGGNSGQLIHVVKGIIKNIASLPIGTLIRINGGNETFAERMDYVAEQFETVTWLKELHNTGIKIMMVGGSPRAVGNIILDSEKYPLKILHGFTRNAEIMSRHTRDIAKLRSHDLVRMDDNIRARSSTLPHAAAVIQTLIRYLKPEEISFSETGPREGIIYSRLSLAEQQKSPFVYACKHYFQQAVSQELPARLHKWMSSLLEARANVRPEIARGICYLSNCAIGDFGRSRADDAYSRIMAHEFGDCTHKERVMSALAIHARYQGPTDRYAPAARELLSGSERKTAVLTGLTMRLADKLAMGTNLLNQTSLLVTPEEIRLSIPDDFPITHPDTVVNLIESIGQLAERKTRLVGPKSMQFEST